LSLSLAVLERSFKDLTSKSSKDRRSACSFFLDDQMLGTTAKTLGLNTEELKRMATDILSEDGARAEKLVEQSIEKIRRTIS
jgi:hypothetical protein